MSRMNFIGKVLNSLAGKAPATDTGALQANAAGDLAKGLQADSMPGYTNFFIEATITPEKIKSAIESYRKYGKLQGLSNLFSLFLDSDDNLQSAVDVRKEALKTALWSFGEEMPEAKKKFFDDLIGEKLGDWIDTFIEAKLMGWHFNQILWAQDEAGYWMPEELIEYQNLDLRVARRELTLYENEKPAAELPPYKFIIHAYRRPKLSTVLKYYVFYAFAINNWAQFTETYGKPMRLGKYDPTTTKTELAVLKSAVKALGTDQAAIISKNTEIEFKEFLNKAASSDLYKTLCDFVNNKVTKVILGQTLTTENGNGVGSYALGEVHNEVRGDIMQADITDLRGFVNMILDYVDAVNFGGRGVKVWFTLPKQVNLEKRVVIDTALINTGLKVSEDYLYDTYGVDRPEDGQEIVVPPRVTPPVAPNQDRPFFLDAQAGIDSDLRLTVCSAGGNDKSLAKLQREIRALGSLEELKEYNPRWFIAEFGGDLAATAVVEYLKERGKGQKGKRGNAEVHAPASLNSSLPEISWEWDETSIVASGRYRNQAFIISGVRTKSALAELMQTAQAVVDAGGDFREFIQAAALQGYAPENPAWWKTEFETAKVSAAMAGKWAEIQEDEDIFPWLQYVTMRDGLVREEHAVLDGTVARVGDPFWDMNTPPNGWNCRCSVEQLTEGEAKGLPRYGQAAPDYVPPPEFRGNVGKGNILPGNAGDEYGEYAEGEDTGLNSDVGKRGKGQEGKREKGAAAPGFILDAMGYPVMADNEQVIQIIQQPDEIWQGKGSTNYIRREDGWVWIVKTEDAAVTEIKKRSEAEYRNEGREGFREL